MAERITRKHLAAAADRLNRKLHRPTELFSCVEKTEENPTGWKQNPGHFHIDSAYDGYQLSVSCEGGGTKNVIATGFVKPRALLTAIEAYTAGVEGAA